MSCDGHIVRQRSYSKFFLFTYIKLLVYDHMPMGSLSSLLHGNRLSGRSALDWERRLGISLAAARGVASIHSAGPSSYHGNIKSSNVLLSDTHDACVSEDGLTTLGQVGLFLDASCYCAPDVTNDKRVSQKADVYSFGVLPLELLTSMAPRRSLLSEVFDLPRWLRSVVREWAAELLDQELLRHQQKGGEEECMMRLLQLAMDCCSQDADKRPTMFHVVQRIEEIQQS